MSDPRDASPMDDGLRTALAPEFLLVAPIGKGGMGSVYLAREPALRRLVAVKVLAPALADDAEARARFEREAQAVASFAHPHIVGIHRVAELPDGTPYIVMQYVEGRSLADRLREEGPMPSAVVRRYLGEVATALAAAHAKGIIHRDIKPANVLYDRELDRVLVSDFGISALRGADLPGERLTAAGALVGTPKYMSPEQLLAEEVTEKTDIYGLGLLAYELLTGDGPFIAASTPELIAAHLRDTPPRLSERIPDVDPELEELVSTCLAKRPADRPAASALAKRLEATPAAVVEWPPPGLDAFLGRASVHARRLLAGAAGVVASFLLLVGFGTQVDPRLDVEATALVTFVGLAGGSLLLLACAGLLVTAGRLHRAVRLGYDWRTALEVLADDRRDTGALIAGIREYAGLASGDRTRLRRRRMVRAIVALAIAPALLFGILVASWMARAGLVPASATPIATLVPALLVALAGGLLDVHERVALRALRRRVRTTQAPAMAARLADAWYAALEDSAERAAPSRTRRRRRWGAIAGASGVVLAAATMLAAFLPLLEVSGNTEFAIPLDATASALMQIRLRVNEVGLPHAVPVDARITPTEAGESLARLHRSFAAGRREPRLPARELDTLPWMLPPDSTLFAAELRRNDRPRLVDDLAVIARARGGFTPAEAAWLRAFAAHPAWTAFGRVARAPAIDVLAGRYDTPLPDSARWWLVDVDASYPVLVRIVHTNGLRAAWHLAAGRRDAAVETARETIGFGRTMLGSFLAADALSARVAIRRGQEQLIAVLEALGDPAASRLRTQLDSATADAASRFEAVQIAAGRARRPGAPMDRAVMLSVVRDGTQPVSLRAQYLLRLAVSPCTNARELLFGHAPEVRSAFALADTAIARYESERALLRTAGGYLERAGRTGRDWVPYDDLGWAARVRFSAWDYALRRFSSFALANERLHGCTRLLIDRP